MAGRCIPKVPDGNITFNGLPVVNEDKNPVTADILAEASNFVGKFYRATEVMICNSILFVCVFFFFYKG